MSNKIVETFNQFLQQASLAQTGNPKLFAEKLKTKKNPQKIKSK